MTIPLFRRTSHVGLGFTSLCSYRNDELHKLVELGTKLWAGDSRDSCCCFVTRDFVQLYGGVSSGRNLDQQEVSSLKPSLWAIVMPPYSQPFTIIPHAVTHAYHLLKTGLLSPCVKHNNRTWQLHNLCVRLPPLSAYEKLSEHVIQVSPGTGLVMKSP